MLSSSLYTILKLSKTTSPNKLFDYDCVTLYRCRRCETSSLRRRRGSSRITNRSSRLGKPQKSPYLKCIKMGVGGWEWSKGPAFKEKITLQKKLYITKKTVPTVFFLDFFWTSCTRIDFPFLHEYLTNFSQTSNAKVSFSFF